MDTKTLKQGFLFATGAFAYICAVVLLMTNAERLFGDVPAPLPGIAALLLFVVSATITGSLVLGKPVVLYLDGKKMEAFRLFFTTLGFLILIGIVLFFILAAFK